MSFSKQHALTVIHSSGDVVKGAYISLVHLTELNKTNLQMNSD